MEEWTRWKPTPEISGKFTIESISFSFKDLIVRLVAPDHTQKIELIFENGIDIHRYTNASCSLSLFAMLEEAGDKDFYQNWSFFKIENSYYLAWIKEKSNTWSDMFKFEHFCILGDDDAFEILSEYQPKIRIIE
jgi:hypothetical protein